MAYFSPCISSMVFEKKNIWKFSDRETALLLIIVLPGIQFAITHSLNKNTEHLVTKTSEEAVCSCYLLVLYMCKEHNIIIASYDNIKCNEYNQEYITRSVQRTQ